MSLPELVEIPAGPFVMGSNARADEKPVAVVEQPAFAIARTLVTNAQFGAFVADTGFETQAETERWAYTFTGSHWGEIEGADWRHPEGPGSAIDDRATHPALNVSWFDAMSYCRWLGDQLGGTYRLQP